MNYALKTRAELLGQCRERKIIGYSTKKKDELVRILEGNDAVAVAVAVTAATAVPAKQLLSLTAYMNTVQLGDCLEHMRRMPANSIDMVCTDPPYFLDGLDANWNKKSLDSKGASSLVGNLPKGMKFDRNQSKKFREFYETIAAEVFRVLKPGGAFLSFSSPRLYHAMATAVEEAGFEIRDMLAWIYTQSQVKAFSQDHIIDKDKIKTAAEKESLKDLCKDWKTPQLKPAIEPICLAVKPIEGRYIDNFEKYGVGLMNTSADTKVGAENDFFPSNIVTTEEGASGNPEMDRVFLVGKPTKAEKGDFNTHLSVKPVALIGHLVKLFTKEGAVVLDPFMGSGTTAVACLQTKRNYIGFDINTEYIEIAAKRITQTSS